MKKLFFSLSSLVFLTFLAHAQNDQRLQPPSPEEKLKHVNELIEKEVQPTATQKAAIEQAFKTFFIAADQLRKDNPPPPPPPPDPKVKAAMDKLVQQRDERIKEVLNEKQYEKYLNVTEKMHPPKPGDPNTPPPPPSPKN
jgi:hypothetical protein